MSLGFLDHMRVVPDHRIAGMVTYPLDEVLLALRPGFAAWAALLRAEAREVIAVDSKTLRGSKTPPEVQGALHLVSAYATAAGLAWIPA
jgi:hypothetical protein